MSFDSLLKCGETETIFILTHFKNIKQTQEKIFQNMCHQTLLMEDDSESISWQASWQVHSGSSDDRFRCYSFGKSDCVSQYLTTWLISGTVEHDLEFRILSLRIDGNTDLCGWPLYYILKKSLAKQVDGVNNNCKENV